jgi:hypothetical protein
MSGQVGLHHHFPFPRDARTAGFRSAGVTGFEAASEAIFRTAATGTCSK